LRAPGKKRGRRAAPSRKRGKAATLSARLISQAKLEAQADGSIGLRFENGYSLGLGRLSAQAASRAQELRTGLSFGSVVAGEEVDRLVRLLARRGLLEYRLAGARKDEDQVVVEPQMPDYWPRTPPLGDADVLVLSRFAYVRRRGNEMVLESPRAGALFRICDPKVATAIATLSQPQPIKRLRRQEGFPGLELLALLVDSRILLEVDAAGDSDLRFIEGNDDLVLWDFHDLLFHARSTEGRHANPLGGEYPYVGVIASPPAVRPSWPGAKIDLHTFSPPHGPLPNPPPHNASQTRVNALMPGEGRVGVAKLLRERHSTRTFDERRPITLAELARFLDGAARVQAQWSSKLDEGDDSPMIEHAARPYPSGGGSWELELYLAVDKCDGLPRGFYHYDAGAHALVPIDVRLQELDAQLASAQFAMAAPALPQILITIAARFGRVSWKYSSIAYSLILKDVGVLLQTLYLVATDIGLGGCAIGSTNIEQLARLTGIEFHVEGAVGQFALGRGAEVGAPGNGR
jgi:SagB-type dehydrogenase family enzyme